MGLSMEHGGKRPGAGRPKGRGNKRRAVVDTPAADSTPSAAVEGYAHLGLGHEDIAQLIGVGLTELRSKFGRELETGAAKGKAKVLAALMTLAGTIGNRDQLAAIKLWLGIDDGASRPLGKKAQAAADAETAGRGTAWGSDLKTQLDNEPSDWSFLDRRRATSRGD
jgi:hypothetical protein